MTYLDRIKLELQDISFNDTELSILAQENGINNPTSEYDPTSNTAKRAIYSTVLSVLEAIANNPNLMKNYKNEDISIMDFAESIQNRIAQLERKIRLLPADDVSDNIADGASWTYIFREWPSNLLGHDDIDNVDSIVYFYTYNTYKIIDNSFKIYYNSIRIIRIERW